MGIIAVKRRKFFIKTLKFAEIMDAGEERHLIHSCYAAGWEKY